MPFGFTVACGCSQPPEDQDPESGEVQEPFGPEIARPAKHEKAAVILAKVTEVKAEKRVLGSQKRALHLDVKRVHHVGKDVHLTLSPGNMGLYFAYDDGGRRFSTTFGTKPFPHDSIEKGGTYWLVVTQFLSSGVWVVARERVRAD